MVNNKARQSARVQTLVSTMNIDTAQQAKELSKTMHINNYIIISQTSITKKTPLDNGLLACFNERGLSKSRNRALSLSSSEICLISDDDVIYIDDYQNIIYKAFQKNKKADIIVFHVQNAKKKNAIKRGKIGYIKSLKVCSVQIAFRRQSIIDKQIKFNDKFGSGSGLYISGEENIFLSDCLKKGCKIFYEPITIGTLQNSSSSWFRGYSNQYFNTKGACFKEIFPNTFRIFIIIFALKKYPLYKMEQSFLSAMKLMINGATSYVK